MSLEHLAQMVWTCHVCGEERPDENIAVYTSDISAKHGLQPGTVFQNVRFCNDRVACMESAPGFDLLLRKATT